mgnify:CR=1 FL=1
MSNGRAISKAGLPPSGISKLEYYIKNSNYDMLENSEDYYRRNELLERIYRRGTDTFDFRRDTIYKENYLEMFKRYDNLDNYEEVVEKLESIDVKDFYKFVKEIDPEGADNFGDHYKNPLIQVEFNNYARRLGIKIDETIDPVTEDIF